MSITTPGNVSKAELWLQAAFFYFFLCGVVGTVANGLIVTAIQTNHKLRSRFFSIISYLSVCRLLLCLNTAEMGAQRMLRLLGRVGVVQPSGVCNLFHIWFMGALTLELMLILFMIVDRVIGIVFPLAYSRMGDSQARHICRALYVVTGVKIATGFFWGIRPWDRVECVNTFSGVSEQGGNASRYVDVGLGVAIILLYAGLIGKIHLLKSQKNRRIEDNDDDDDDDDQQSRAAKMSLERQLNLLPLLRNQVVLHTAISFASKVLVFSAVVFPAQYERLTTWGGYAVAIDVVANTMVLLLGNKEIRKTAYSILLHCGCTKTITTTTRTMVVAPLPRTTAVDGGKSWVTGASPAELVPHEVRTKSKKMIGNNNKDPASYDDGNGPWFVKL